MIVESCTVNSPAYLPTSKEVLLNLNHLHSYKTRGKTVHKNVTICINYLIIYNYQYVNYYIIILLAFVLISILNLLLMLEIINKPLFHM